MGKKLLIIIVLLIVSCTIMKVEAEEVKGNKAIRAIIGEASGEGYTGMVAVACAIRNRGTLKGVYGQYAKHVDKEPQWVWGLAKKAWKESKNVDIVNGGDHWESTDFPVPSWAKEMTVTKRVGKHIFYK
ncbi:MAG: hypothetical protein KAQ99_08635 [Candidatus Aureabacteria bacterium]|nr:hypothetical protein [Candidatus Auribacterota bacterium]